MPYLDTIRETWNNSGSNKIFICYLKYYYCSGLVRYAKSLAYRMNKLIKKETINHLITVIKSFC